MTEVIENNTLFLTSLPNISQSMNFIAVNQTDDCLEFSCPERSVSFPVYVFIYVAAAAVVLLTVCGNLLVIISVSHFKQLHTPANILILSLAVSDFLVGVFVLPFNLISMTESCWIWGRISCIIFSLVSFQVTMMSIYTVTLIAVDRFLALNYPFLYSEKISPTVTGILTLVNWVFSLLYNFTIIFINGNISVSVMCSGQCYVIISEVSSFIDLLVVFLIPCTLIIILYTHVFFIAKKHAIAIRALQVHNNTESSKNRMSDSMKSERKAALVLCILVSVFLMCLLPYYIYSLIIQFTNADLLYAKDVTIMIFLLNSSINPIIYALFYPWFQRCLKLIVTFKVFYKDSSLINVL
ncbi:trace amine-associated receptor 13c-like [Myxocyprinus asiaticus]|uniref:trace amine-associated receptor 13c-like n=1 Tax=Myxocyprinus asiaticus TaxID=70543 RepID=UPI002223E0AF|nr:trace amine-associated receptor 13c-like [Myxocyprinus asiaticus]